MLKESWDARIQRAERLADAGEATRELLAFYGKLLRAQKRVYEYLHSRRGWLPSGLLEEDLDVARAALPDLLRAVESDGPPALAEEARLTLRAGRDEIDVLLLEQWRAPSDVRFFEKAFLQPYACWLAESGARPIGRDWERRENLCPFCGGRPQVSFLQTPEPGAESGGRGLVCSACLTAWPFRRVVCANCGEERPAKLGYFQSPEYEHIRVEVCDTCRHYIKGIDLTRLGLAVPVVDEVAAAALDVWAREQGYAKVELNLVGL
ncbi:MAG TPA: formate dehydrogenase accessory protein FdhE [Pyrinomonadaceae bacterium]|nr:formate dehydrogenase accessory protein FdhE [Pyrinomonadaceae bacterium]